MIWIKKISTGGEGKTVLSMPAFVNAHVHLGETVFKGIAPINDLDRYIQNTEQKNRLLEKGDYDKICEYTLLQLIKSGTAHISCGRGWESVRKAGIRGSLGYPLMKTKKLGDYTKRFIPKYFFSQKKRLERGKISVGIWIHSLDKVDKEILKTCEKIIKQDKTIGITVHVAETKKQVARCRKTYGKSEIEALAEHGLLTKRTNLIHCIHLSDKDLKIIKKHGSSITVCPSSNLRMHGTIGDLDKMHSLGINICVGTDGFATGNSKNLLDELRQLNNHFGGRFCPSVLFDMITINPMRLLQNKEIIKPSKLKRDIIFFEYDSRWGDTPEEIASQLIKQAPNPIAMVINNRKILDDYIVKTMDEKRITREFTQIKKKVKNG